MQTSTYAREATCEACVKAYRRIEEEDSARRSRQRIELERVSGLAYAVYQHRSGASVPFQWLAVQEQMAWREVVEYIVDECEDETLKILREQA